MKRVVTGIIFFQRGLEDEEVGKKDEKSGASTYVRTANPAHPYVP